MRNIRILVAVSLLVSIEVLLTRFLSIETPVVRISLGFLPVAFAAMLFGPLIGGITGALADAAGILLFSRGGIPFPGFTISAALAGILYGVFLYKKPASVLRTALAAFCVLVFIDLTLNTFWLTMITGKAAAALLPVRAVKCAIMFPIQVFTINTLWRLAGSGIQKRYGEYGEYL